MRLVLFATSVLYLSAQAPAPPATEEQAAALRELIATSPRLPRKAAPLMVQVPSPDWDSDYISSVAVGRNGLVYLLHRNPKLEPVVALDAQGKIVRSWGHGLYKNPHSI